MGDERRLAGEEDVRRMELEVDKLFNSLMVSKNPFGLLFESTWRPPTDVYETADQIVVLMEIPNILKEDIQISLNDDVLTIRGRRNERNTEAKVRYHQMEIHYGCFERSIVLPRNIDRENIQDAAYSDGFLKIVIPKKKRPSGGSSIKVTIRL